MTRIPDGQTEAQKREWQERRKRFLKLSNQRTKQVFSAAEEAEYQELLAWHAEWLKGTTTPLS